MGLNGFQMLINSIPGGKDLMAMAERMQGDGTLQRIEKFADDLEKHNALLERVSNALERLAGADSAGTKAGELLRLAGPDVEEEIRPVPPTGIAPGPGASGQHVNGPVPFLGPVVRLSP